MVRIPALISFILLISVSASASPAIPSFEFSSAQLQSSIVALRASQVQARSAASGPQIDSLAWDLQRYERDTQRLRNDLRWLQQRLRQAGSTQPGQPNTDPSLRWDVQRLSQDLAQMSRDSQWRLNDLRFLASSATKDETLVAPVSRLLDAARRLKSETTWFTMDARFAYFDFTRAGFPFEAMDLDRNSRDLDTNAQSLQSEADKLLTKVRP